MKFLEKRYYCSSCSKDVYYLTFQKHKREKSCPICGANVEFYWRELDTKYISFIIIGVSFFSFATIYSFWMLTRGGVFVIDSINISIDFILACTFAIIGLQNRKKNSTYETKQNSKEFSTLYKKQTIYVFVITMTGFAIASVLNIGLFFLAHH